MDKKIEIELRTMFDKEKYDWLLNFLLKNGEDLGEDDKDTYFFIFNDQLLKVVKNISKGTGKIVLKNGLIGKKVDWEEIEIPLHIKEVERMAELFIALRLPAQLIHSRQKRHNFIYKGIEFAVKYSDDWGYHAELEKMISDSSKVKQAEDEIKKVADELGLRLMTHEEEICFTQKVQADYRKKGDNKFAGIGRFFDENFRSRL